MKPEIKACIRPHFLAYEGYISAGMEAAKDDSSVFLNANENPYTLPSLPEGSNRYPQPQPRRLAQLYSHLYDVPAEWVAMTRGADEAITLLTQLFCEPQKGKVLQASPCFGVYAISAAAMPGQIVDVPLIKTKDDFALDVAGIINAAQNDETIKLIYLTSPNNPTGGSFPHEQILEIAKAVQGRAVVILDETYAEFSQQGSLSHALDQTPNLMILRTLSKSYALAGMRMGSILCADPHFITLFTSKVLDVYPLTVGSINAALLLEDETIQAQAKANIKILLKDRDTLKERLIEQNAVKKIYKSDANFLLVEMERAAELAQYCAQHKFYIRDVSTKPGTENCLRISIGTPEQNDLLLTHLNAFFS